MPNGPFQLPIEDLDRIVERSRALWPKLDGARVLMTGGTGLFGKWIVGALLHARSKRKFQVSIDIVTRTPEKHAAEWPEELGARSEGVNLLFADLSHASPDWATADFIIHAAAETRAEQDGATHCHDILAGTDKVLNFAVRTKPRRLLYVSSGAVYDHLGLHRLARESDARPGEPISEEASYARGKRVSEDLLLQSGVSCLIARPFSFVGPWLPLRAHFAIGNFIADALGGQQIVIRGDGTTVRSYLYMSDLAQWLLELLFVGDDGAIINVGSDEAFTLRDVATMCARSESLQSSARVVPTVLNIDPPPTRRWHYAPDISEAKKLGLEVSVPLAEAIEKSMRWAQRYPAVLDPRLHRS